MIKREFKRFVLWVMEHYINCRFKLPFRTRVEEYYNSITKDEEKKEELWY